jgi:hypothetical protein
MTDSTSPPQKKTRSRLALLGRLLFNPICIKSRGVSLEFQTTREPKITTTLVFADILPCVHHRGIFIFFLGLFCSECIRGPQKAPRPVRFITTSIRQRVAKNTTPQLGDIPVSPLCLQKPRGLRRRVEDATTALGDFPVPPPPLRRRGRGLRRRVEDMKTPPLEDDG